MSSELFAVTGVCVPDACFRRDYSHQNDARQQRSFFVKCVGEGVDDNGGPYRAVVGAATGEEPAGPLEMLVRMIALCLL